MKEDEELLEWLELEFVPCNIIEITDTESAEIALLENLTKRRFKFYGRS